MTDNTPKQTLTDFIRTLDARLTATEMAQKAREAGFKPVRKTSKPLAEWLSNRVQTIRSAEGIAAKHRRVAKAEAKTNGHADAKPKLAHFKTAKPKPTQAQTVVYAQSPALTIEAAELQLRQIVAKIGTLRTRQIIDAWEAGLA